MVVDSSALMAILMNEPERMDFLARMVADSTCLVSTVSYLECSMLMFSRKGGGGVDQFDALLKRLGIELVSADAAQAMVAREAFLRFGKGHHAAKLNLGDCFAYALAKYAGEPLLFKGNDFSKTDVAVA
jgi:ribonuclease VapC